MEDENNNECWEPGRSDRYFQQKREDLMENTKEELINALLKYMIENSFLQEQNIDLQSELFLVDTDLRLKGRND